MPPIDSSFRSRSSTGAPVEPQTTVSKPVPPAEGRTGSTMPSVAKRSGVRHAPLSDRGAPLAAFSLVNRQYGSNAVLRPSATAAERTAAFSTYMDKFTNLDAVSNFVIGKYARRFTEAELTRYRKAFRTYALTVYEYELDAYRGEAVEVKSSVDRSETDSIVNTVIKRQDGTDMDVRWRVQGKEGNYKVVDVALNLDGNLIWLAIEQRAQFIALLDKNNGSADALIKKIESMTAELKSKSRS